MQIIKNLKRNCGFLKQLLIWKRIKVSIPTIAAQKTSINVVVPCDPETVGGSRGDEAMIIASIQQLRDARPESKIYIVVSDNIGEDYVNSLPFEEIYSLKIWNGSNALNRIYRSIVSLAPECAIILGADCMDGFYSPFMSLMLLSLHDLLSKTPTIQCRLLGFSYNEHPSWLMNIAFRLCSKNTFFNIRDPYSYARFKKFTGRNARLVADEAFMLKPTYRFCGYENLERWGKEKKDSKMTIVGFNFHPMLKQYTSKDDIQSDALEIAQNLQSILEKHLNVAFVLIPHDNRSRLNDNIVLSTINSYLVSRGLGDRLYYDSYVYRANELKGLCSLLDGLISSRMHLAIAALGQQKPVMVASYQGKFEGLFEHFQMDKEFILPPDVFISTTLIKKFDFFLSNLGRLRERVKEYLPKVLCLSSKNIADFNAL